MPTAPASRFVPPHIDWQRFWCPLGGAINCGDDGRGFLADPEGEYTSHLNTDVRPLSSLLPSTGPLILCGDPGIGKTTELRKVRQSIKMSEAGDALISLNFRQHVSTAQDLRAHTVESPTWKSWLVGSNMLTFMIDGIDEGLIRIPTLVSILIGQLEDQPLDRLRLMLTCRSAEWPHAQGERLVRLWPATALSVVPLFELCPLRFFDAQLAANAWGVEWDPFIQEIRRTQTVGLATRPITLFFLLGEFRTRGCFPGTHRELYQRGTLKLANEVDPERLEILRRARNTISAATPEQRLAAGQRIAALLLCCGKRAIDRDTGELDQPVTDGDIVLSQCSTSNLGAYEDVVESALFSSMGQQRFGFLHQTFAECLASETLATLSLPQIRSLLMQCDSEGEHVIPQLIEVTAWTAGRHPEFCEHLLRVDPAALLHCDVSVLTPALKAALIDAILLSAEAGQVVDYRELRRFFNTLTHPRLAAQLRAVVNDKTRGAGARRIAIDIARSCDLEEFTDDFLCIAADPGEPIRADAAVALCIVIPDTRLAELEPFARGDAGPDRMNEIRSEALRRLIPKRWSVADALPHLVPRARSNYHGVYESFVQYTLPQLITVSDIPAALMWLQDNPGCFDSLSSRHKLTIRIVEMALIHLDQPEIARAFTEFWLTQAEEGMAHHIVSRSEIKPLFDSSQELRRLVLCLFVNALDSVKIRHSLPPVTREFITSPEDFDWLLDQAHAAAPEQQPTWTELIAKHVWDPRLLTPNWDKFLRRRDDVPELARHFEWLRAWALDEPVARKAKAQWLCEKRQNARHQKLMESWKEPDPKPIRLKALEQARQGDVDAWYQLWHVLHWGDGPTESDPLWKLRVEDYKGWGLLATDEQGIAKIAAHRFLAHHAEDAVNWSPRNEVALASTSALWLLRDELSPDAPLAAIARHWIRLFALFHDSSDDAVSELLLVLYRVDQQAVIAAMLGDIRREAHLRYPFALRAAKDCWDFRFDEALRDFSNTLVDPKMLAGTIAEWASLSPDAAGAFALQQLKRSLAGLGTIYPVELKELLVATLSIRPLETFSASQAILESDWSLANAVWSGVLCHIHVGKELWYSLFSDSQLADLYLHLVKVLPRCEDPAEDFGFIAPRTSAAWERDRIPTRLAGRATRSACAALRRLVQELPDQASNLRWVYRNALVQCRRNDWLPPSPSNVVKLIENAQARLIGSERELKDVVLESLSRFQRHLTGTTFPAVEELWSRLPKAKSGSKIEPKGESVLQHAVARWLRDDLGAARGILANCEVEPRPGSYTDIYVETVSRRESREFEQLTVVIEIKGCWHNKVRTAMHSQLVQGYLRSNGLSTGIYLIGWFVCPACPNAVNKTGQSSPVDLTKWLNTELVDYDGRKLPEDVSGFVLDCSWPQSSPSSR